METTFPLNVQGMDKKLTFPLSRAVISVTFFIQMGVSQPNIIRSNIFLKK